MHQMKIILSEWAFILPYYRCKVVKSESKGFEGCGSLGDKKSDEDWEDLD